MNDHEQLFSACTQTLEKPQQIAFIAAYFTTTSRHAEWLLEAYKRYLDECHEEIQDSVSASL